MRTAHKAGISAAGAVLAFTLITHWEGHNYTVVHLPFDPPGVLTVCGGITNYDVPSLRLGQKYTEETCRALWIKIIPKYAKPIAECVPSFSEMQPYRQAALTSFAVNLGPARICKTSIGRDLNAGRVRQACDAMRKYILANGRRLQGLVNRRNDPVWGERNWCLRED